MDRWKNKGQVEQTMDTGNKQLSNGTNNGHMGNGQMEQTMDTWNKQWISVASNGTNNGQVEHTMGGKQWTRKKKLFFIKNKQMYIWNKQLTGGTHNGWETMDRWDKRLTNGTTNVQMEQTMYGWMDEQINWQDVRKKKEH